MRFERRLVPVRAGARPWVLRGRRRAPSSPGEAVVVLGRNGAGKSTLLQLAAGVLRPGRGRGHATGRRVVGWVPERSRPTSRSPSARYLHRDGRGARAARSRGRRPVDRWIDRLGLTEHRRHPARRAVQGHRAEGRAGPGAAASRPACWSSTSRGRASTPPTRTLVPEIIAEVIAAGGAVLVSDHRGEIARLPGAIALARSAEATRRGRARRPPATVPTSVIVEVAGRAGARRRADGRPGCAPPVTDVAGRTRAADGPRSRARSR